MADFACGVQFAAIVYNDRVTQRGAVAWRIRWKFIAVGCSTAPTRHHRQRRVGHYVKYDVSHKTGTT